MPLDHPLTIQDATTQFWQLARSDLFVLAGPNKKIVALHMKMDELREKQWETLIELQNQQLAILARLEAVAKKEGV